MTLASGGILFAVCLSVYAVLILGYMSAHDGAVDSPFCVCVGIAMGIGMLVLWVAQALLLKKVDSIFVERNSRLRRIVDATSHELKTPLTLTMANLDVLEMENGSDELIDDMRDEVRGMANIVQKMVDLSHHEEGEWSLTIKHVDASALITRCVDGFRARADARGLHLYEEIEKNVKCNIDEDEMKQVVFILLDNAVKYCDEGGAITVIMNEDGPLQIELRVENTYADVDPDEFGVLFDRFYRSDKVSQDISGDGLGLSLARMSAKKLGGTIDVYERADIGAIGFKVNV